MKVLIDTNVVLDVLANRKPHVDDSLKILKLCEVKAIDGYISALSIPNIVYVLRKELTPDKTQDIIDKLSLIFSIVDLKSDDVTRAAKLSFNDYEDALQSCQAARIKTDYIVTRNVKDFLPGKVMAITPAELLARI